MRKDGFSILELVVSVLLSTLLMAIFGYGVKIAISGRQKTYTRAEVPVEVASLYENILQVGRLATPAGADPACAKKELSLECQVDFNAPPTGTLTKVRFVFDPSTKVVAYEKAKGAGWEPIRKYTDIVLFDLCDDTDMAPDTNNIVHCPISPQEAPGTFGMSRVHADLVAKNAARKNRFFRFRIQGGVSDKQVVSDTQGAFYVRHPLAPPFDQLAFQWGTLE